MFLVGLPFHGFFLDVGLTFDGGGGGYDGLYAWDGVNNSNVMGS